MQLSTSALALLAALSALAAPVAAQTALTTVRVASGLSSPLYLASPPGDVQRQFIVEQGGKIKILQDGVLLGTPFLDVGPSGLNLITSGGERGLLGLAFHPSYASNRFFYVDYTDLGGDTIVRRYQALSSNPNLADTTSGVVIIGPIDQPQSNHNGGCLQFGPDGKLYIAMGDGGGANDSGTGHAVGGNAQSGATLLGKLLRLDVDIAAPYIPGDNPFVGNPSVLDEIWSLGLRNPWRFSFDRALGHMYIGDVGQSAQEEIDYEPAGAGGRNYGWRCMEGFDCTGLSGCVCNSAPLTLPVHDYDHSNGCSVTGGYVYRGCAIPDLVGTYFFGDYCSARIWSFRYDGTTMTEFMSRTAELAPGGGMAIGNISSYGEDARGEIYVCDIDDGEVYKIVAASEADCNLNGQSDVCDIALGSSQDLDTNGVPDECECAPAPFVYCTAKVNSQFCTPAISFSGAPSASALLPFRLEASQVLNQRLGTLFYGYSAAAIPFQGGYLCSNPPRRRAPAMNSGGTPTGTDCSGFLSLDFNVRIASGIDPVLVVGQQVNAQWWSRDGGVPSGTNLTDAVQFVICD